MIFSDGGATWRRGDIAIVGGGECIAAELSDGRVILNARNSASENRRAVAFSRNDVTGWSKTEFVPELLEPGCMASLVSHPGTEKTEKPFLLFSNPDTTDRPHSAQRDVTIKLS